MHTDTDQPETPNEEKARRAQHLSVPVFRSCQAQRQHGLPRHPSGPRRLSGLARRRTSHTRTHAITPRRPVCLGATASTTALPSVDGAAVSCAVSRAGGSHG